MRRIDFKIGILKSGLTNVQLAEEMGWPPGKPSRVINGTYDPTQAEREALAAILGQSVQDIFPERIIMLPSEHFPSPEVA